MSETICPFCGREMVADATRCGYCWKPTTREQRRQDASASEEQGYERTSDQEAWTSNVQPTIRPQPTNASFTSAERSSSQADSSPPSTTTPAAPRRDAAMRRYRDAYLVARAITAWGVFIKVFGVLGGVALVAAFIALAMGLRDEQAGAAVVAGVVLGGGFAAFFYLLGVIVAAQGQVLKASLDGAVHTSPFLNDDERAATISL